MSSNIFQNPVFQNLSPEKLQFLMEFHEMQKPDNANQAAPFFMQTLKQAKNKGIQFTPDESTLLIEILKQNMSEADQKKADMIMQMMSRKK